MNLPKIKLNRENFILVSVLIIALSIPLTVVLLGVRQELRKKAETGALVGVGYPYLINAAIYGLSPQESEAATTGLYGDNTKVQNLQPPSISGFSSDLFTGTSTVSYPLDLPPGRGGLTPSISLTYSSAGVYDPVLGADFNEDGDHDPDDVNKWKDQLNVQSSQVGLGWNIGGLGYVFRDSTGRYTLVLNGQSYRLFKSPTENNWDGETWHTDPESFLKIQHQVITHDETAGEGTKPNKFVVYDTNGTYYEFTPRGFFWKRCDYQEGEGAGLKCVQANTTWCQQHGKCTGSDCTACEQWAISWNKWVLNRVCDVHGNEIDIPYDEERGWVQCTPKQAADSIDYTYPRAIYPHQINYSGTYTNLDAGFDAQIEFVLADREDDDYIKEKGEGGCGISFYSKKRVTQINVKVRQYPSKEWKIVWQYELRLDEAKPYFTASNDATKKLHPRLATITARGRDNATLPPYNFTYYDDANNLANFRLLQSADNGYGGKVTYAYQSYNANDFLPKTGDSIGTVFGNHRVTEEIAEDGRGNTFKTNYDYPLDPTGVGISDDNKHSGFESVGHSQVVEKVFKKNSNDILRTSVYEFNQGQGFTEGDCTGKFFVWPERGRVSSVKVYDSNMGTLLSSSESDYLREVDDRVTTCTDYKAKQDTVWNTSHFIATKESRACQDPTSQWSAGSKTTYKYDKGDQNGQQWGNLTQSTTYKIDGDCNSATDLPGATPYRSTHNTYFPNTDSHITNRVAETETFACGQSGFSALGDCSGAKRMALAWNLYDDKSGNNPEQTPGGKGLLTLSRAFYTFPERENDSIGSRNTVDTTFAYNSFGNLTTTTTYDAYGQSSLATPGGGTARVTTIGYDATYSIFPVLAENPLNHTTQTSYKNGGTNVDHLYLADRTITTDINNQQWTTVVDGFGRTKETLVPGEGSTAQTKIDYNDVDKTTTVNPFIVHTQTRDDVGTGTATYQHAWQFYNGLGQVIESQSELEGNGTKISLTATSYNTLGQPEKTLLPYEAANGGTFIQPDFNRPERTEADYDALGRVTKSRTPSKTAGQWYENQTGYYGRKTAVLDPKNHLATTEVDNLGRTISARVFEGTRSLGTPDDYYAETEFQYDHLNRLTKTTDTKGNIAENFYNQFGQKTSSDDPDLGLWRYTYYPTGTLKTITDAKQQVTTFRYDILDRMIYKYYGDVGGATLAASFLYDCHRNGKGRLCSDSAFNPAVLTPTNTNDYNYDEKGRLQSETKTIDGTSYTTSYTYDAAGRQRTITYPDGTHEVVTYSYNDAGLLNNVAGASTYLSSAKYNVLGQPEEEVLGNQTKNVYDYEDNTHRLESLVLKDKNGAALWFQNPFVYDAVGNILNITSPDPANPLQSITYTYSYDDLNRLVGMTSAGPTSAYDYDQLGRMTLKTEEGEVSPECVPEKENPNLPGDLDCDCRVRIVDIMKVVVIWNTRNGDEMFNPNYDFDGDGRITIVDVMYVAARWNTRCP